MILKIQNVFRSFGGLQALANVTFEVPEGEILGLIGPNGAGKTTLFNVINGVYEPNKGNIIFKDDDITSRKPYHISRKGLARTHQIVKPLKDLTILENVMVGACFGREGHSLAEARLIAGDVLDFVGLNVPSDQLAGILNVAQKKRLELARALASRPYLLLLDEVLAGLNQSEIQTMVETVKAIRQQGVTIIMIEHVMHAVMNVSDRIIVLDYGVQIAEGSPSEIANDEKVIEAYLGDPKLAEKLSGID
ncbi:MAG: ABC transporter ATP-binding protein [Chloroflexi bacterium RBG_16_54_18]|nr:MAG: ABC transporter ATP-binding protein [Chloroflexi bacterium RBG_16_54_18]